MQLEQAIPDINPPTCSTLPMQFCFTERNPSQLLEVLPIRGETQERWLYRPKYKLILTKFCLLNACTHASKWMLQLQLHLLQLIKSKMYPFWNIILMLLKKIITFYSVTGQITSEWMIFGLRHLAYTCVWTDILIPHCTNSK